MDPQRYQPPNDAVGFLIVLVVSIAAGLSMKFVIDTWGDVGVVLVVPMLLVALSPLTSLSPE